MKAEGIGQAGWTKGLTADWTTTLSADPVTLAPGVQATITARAMPGLAGLQGWLQLSGGLLLNGDHSLRVA